jgi:hypothetical protein
MDNRRPTHRFQLTCAFSFCQNGPETEIDNRWHHLAEVMRQNHTPCSLDIPRPSVAVFELLGLPVRQNRLEAEIGGRQRNLAEVT